MADVDVDEIQNWFADQAEKCDANFIVPKSAAENGVALSIFGYGCIVQDKIIEGENIAHIGTLFHTSQECTNAKRNLTVDCRQ